MTGKLSMLLLVLFLAGCSSAPVVVSEPEATYTETVYGPFSWSNEDRF